MSHSDDNGLVLPPALAPIHIVIIPIAKTEEDQKEILDTLAPTLDELKKSKLTINSEFLGEYNIPYKVKIDDDSQKTPGWKFNERELKGVPLRIAIGKRDLDQ
jgi:prolyl-tRNA synthetase